MKCSDCGRKTNLCRCIDGRRKECFCSRCYQHRIELSIQQREKFKILKLQHKEKLKQLAKAKVQGEKGDGEKR